YLTLWFPLLIWWTPLCLIRQILTRRFRLYAYEKDMQDAEQTGRDAGSYGVGDFALTLGVLRWEGSVQQPLARFYSMLC
ncbi:hypothetical protein KVP97_23030, partial [Escherichia coli]|nr:hypothetical protein [Escherichia coli]